MVGLRMADGVGGHVRQDEVGLGAERLAQRVGRGVVHEIHLEDLDPVDRLGLQQIDPGDARAGRAAADDLAPAARRDAEVDHRLGALEQVEALVELEQFIGRAAAIALGLGPLAHRGR